MNREGQEYLAKKAKEFHKKMSKKKLDLAAIPAVAFDAQRLEKERLERLVRNKKEFNDSIYTPLVINRPSTKEEENLTANGDDHLRSNCELEDEAEDNQDDDDLFIEEVIQKKPLKNVDLIELGSSEEDDEQPGTSVSKQHLPNKPALQRIHPLSQRHRLGKMHSKRKRRHSAEYDQLEMTPEGRLLINSGRPESDPDVFVAPHLTHILQPHQIGGVRFMYDNVIESLEAFEHSDGFGCILAHSMGLGKTIQAITFTEIFIRVTKRNRVAIICPVNVLQNWNNEFQQWLPKYEKQSSGSSPSEPIRDWDVFLLGDAIKTFETRVELINNWYTKGGVLLIGYEMFKLLIQPDDISTIGTSKITMVKRSKKQQMKADAERTVWELEDNLAKISDEDKRTIVRREELRQQLRQALIGPGPDLVICDEGHRIKNLNTDVASALSSIHTKRRIVLTGYPLQNNLMEYYCMIQFVRPNYLGTRRDFLYQFEKPIRNGQCIDSTKRDMKLAKQRIHVLIQLLRGFVQRRSQHLLKKILPESREYVLLLRKSPIQHALYRAFYHYSLNQAHIGEGSFNPLKGFAICMKIINHPDLLYNAVLKRNPDFGEAQNDGSIKTEEVNSGNNNDAAQNVTLNETKPEPVAEQCNLVSSSSIQQTETEVPQQQEQQSLDIGRWNKPPPSTFQPHHPSEASYWSTTNDASSSSSTSQSAPCYPANQPPMAQPYPNRPTPMPTPAAFGQMPPPMPPYFQPNRQFFPDSLPPFPPPHFRPPPSQHPPWRHQLNQQAFDFNRFGNGNNNVYGDGSYGYSNYHQPPAQQQQQPFFSQPSNYNYFNFQSNNGIGNNYQTPRNFPAYGPYQQSMVPPPPFHPNQLHPNQHFPHHNNQQNPLHFPSSSTQLAAIGNIQPQPQSSAFNNNGAAPNAAHMQNGENCGLFQGTFMDESQQQRQSQRPQQNNTKMEEQQSPESQPNHQQQQPQNNADTEEPTTTTMGMENNSSPVKRTTQTPSRKRPKEPNDLLADEFIFEDNSISLEWAEPLLNSYVLGAVENSSKMLITMEIIGETVKRGEKLLLFSQSVLTLNMIESFLKKQNIVEPDGNSLLFVRNKTYCRFDGTTSGSDREKLIKRFNEDPELRLFLISTRAGSLGVNLVSANRVIIFDVSWNPCHDAQAICRIYRYGQKRKTFIYRLIMGNCMEKQVFNRQVSKQGLQKRVVDEQLVDVAITSREVENLMEYDESLDVLSTSNAFGDCVGMDDDLLKGLLEANGQWLMEEPFLHESMMLESEEGLSAEEKLEAELLFEREKNGINFPPAHEQEEVGQLGSSKLAMPAMHNPPPVPPFNFGNLLSHSTPLPKHIELAETMQQQHAQLQMQRRMAEPELVVGREMCLPRVAQGARCEPTYTLYPGQRVTGFMTIKGAYLRTKDGIILDGSSIPVGAMMPFRSHPQLSMGPRFAHKPPPNKLDQNEIIQIDD